MESTIAPETKESSKLELSCEFRKCTHRADYLVSLTCPYKKQVGYLCFKHFSMLRDTLSRTRFLQDVIISERSEYHAVCSLCPSREHDMDLHFTTV